MACCFVNWMGGIWTWSVFSSLTRKKWF